MVDPAVRANPLYNDPMLFDMYMRALDEVVTDPEVQQALDDFTLSPHWLRAGMVMEACRVLGAAPREFAEYQAILGSAADVPEPGEQAASSRFDDEVGNLIRQLAVGFGVTGVAFVLAGATLWRWAESLAWAGTALVAVAWVLCVCYSLLGTQPGLRLFRSELVSGIGPDLARFRNQLMDSVSHEEFMAQARTIINTRRQDQFGHAYSVRNISGLTETHDITYQIPTGTAAELDGLLGRLDGASIGVAGPRGSGKSTLIRGYCEEGESSPAVRPQVSWRELLGIDDIPEGEDKDLRCIVSAPVDYAPRDFVLHLFAVFCRSVCHHYDRAPAPDSILDRIYTWAFDIVDILRTLIIAGLVFGLPTVIFLHWPHDIASILHIPVAWTPYIALALAILGNLYIIRKTFLVMPRRRARKLTGNTLVEAAEKNLERVRYLQTYTSGWSGTLHLPVGEGQHKREYTSAEQPLSYPEIIEQFRAFARRAASEISASGGRVFIGIDELDKIGAPENAERFLNEIKGIFGIPHLYFLVSVSDDALTAFERRGLPLRDAFDSSFDEIIHVGQLSYAESRRLLYRRVIGLTEPYVALCHCLAGGLARDLIRAARQVVRTAETLAGNRSSAPVDDEAFYSESPGEFLLLRHAPAQAIPTLGAVCSAIVGDELRRKVRAVAHVVHTNTPGQAQGLQDTLYDISRHIVLGSSGIKIVDMASQGAEHESAEAARLRFDFAAYAYFCATLQEVFTERLTTENMVNATSTSAEPGTFDALAAARNAFTLDTQFAWRSITRFRKAWSLETREPIINASEA